MAVLRVEPSKLAGEIVAPPSKSYTHRSFAIALLARGESRIEAPLMGLDTRATIEAARILGAKISSSDETWLVQGTRGKLKPQAVLIDAHNSGTTLRFMSAIASLSPVAIRLTGDESLLRRPMDPLIEALRELGAKAECEGLRGRPPVVVGGGLRGGEAEITGRISSQFISALLLACPYAREDVKLRVVEGLISRSYVEMTLELLDRSGAKVKRPKALTGFKIPSEQVFRPLRLRIPGDFSSAAFVLGAAAISGSRVRIGNLDVRGAQGDKRVIDLLKEFGAEVRVQGRTVEVSSTGELEGIEADCGDNPDLVPILAVLGAVAEGRTVLTNVPHLRLKETDRLRALACELRRMGAEVRELPAELRVEGVRRLRGTSLHSYGDHRMAMALGVAGLVARGRTLVDGAENIPVSYPGFVEDVKKLGGRIEVAE